MNSKRYKRDPSNEEPRRPTTSRAQTFSSSLEAFSMRSSLPTCGLR